MEINIIPKFIDEAASKPAQSVGNTLSNLWELGIGSHVQLWTKKQEHRQQQNLQKYKESIESKTQNIPEENLTEPQMHVVGPAIEASKYYIDSEELRDMFANLISSSIDNRTSNKAHPSFVELIKQLSPLDAENLSFFTPRVALPICEYQAILKEGGYRTLQPNVFMENNHLKDFELIASSMENLSRLGLISITYDKHLKDRSIYDKFYNTELFGYIKERIKSNPNISKADIQPGLVQLTPLGEDFVTICLNYK